MSLLLPIARRVVTGVLSRADVAVGGGRPWDVQVNDPRFFVRALSGSLGMGDSYMDGDWECAQIDELVARVLAAGSDEALPSFQKGLLLARSRLVNLQSVVRAGQVAEAHYDLGNAFFEAMLGPTMTYSCAYFRDAEDLESAQLAKMDLICEKLQLRPGERLLDIGCGWGTLLLHAARKYGCEGVGVTVSREQFEYARARAGGLPVRFLLEDYRSREVARRGPFDKVVSVGMFEHVGQKNHRTFLGIARALLRDDGLFLLHTIGNDHSPTDPWLNKHIFPNGSLPSTLDLAEAAAAEGLVMEDWHNFRADYDRTVMVWHERFLAHAASADPPLPERFRRMWSFYLCAMAGCFRAGSRNQLWQIVFSKRGVRGGYRSVR